jgi:putrescine aminotransferase
VENVAESDPMMAMDLLTRYERSVNPGLARVFRFMGLESAEATGDGALLIDENGTEYIDLAGGYGVMVHGYRHPRLLQAAHRQLEKLAQSSRVLLNRPMVELAEELQQVTPGDLTYSFFCNSGAEAVEAALKLARAATGRSEWISTVGAFHGKTMGALTVSGRDTYRDPFQPLVPGVTHVSYGDASAVRRALHSQVAAVIVEPIQGEGGIIVPPDNYLAEVREACDQTGTLLIVDEVQTGMGRTGRLFAIEHSGVVPDFLCLAKALGGGIMPIGAVVGRPSAWDIFSVQPLIHTSTFGGAPLAAAVALEAIRVTIEERLPERAEMLGNIARRRLDQMQARYPGVIREVRGMGLMLGLEFANAGVAGALMAELFQRHILAVYTLNNDRVIRLIPPLVITEDQLDTALTEMEAAMAAVDQYLDELGE